jgi:formylmethanofuran dehydrogenase subunit E
MTEKTSGFGIGEAGRASEGTAMDRIEAERLQPTTARKMVRCPRCGQMYNARLAMTSSRGTVCPDCYDDAEM